jgi:hypothetical protein
MNRTERRVVLWAFGYMAVYAPLLLAFGLTAHFRLIDLDDWTKFCVIVPFHALGIVQNAMTLWITARDLRLRPFTRRHRLAWGMGMFWTGLALWPVYIFKHALKPRTADSIMALNNPSQSALHR